MSGLETLCFFDSLRIGNLVVEPKRVKASYTLALEDGKTLSQELIYTYAEPVFQKNAESVNLASAESSRLKKMIKRMDVLVEETEGLVPIPNPAYDPNAQK